MNLLKYRLVRFSVCVPLHKIKLSLAKQIMSILRILFIVKVPAECRRNLIFGRPAV